MKNIAYFNYYSYFQPKVLLYWVMLFFGQLEKSLNCLEVNGGNPDTPLTLVLNT